MALTPRLRDKSVKDSAVERRARPGVALAHVLLEAGLEAAVKAGKARTPAQLMKRLYDGIAGRSCSGRRRLSGCSTPS